MDASVLNYTVNDNVASFLNKNQKLYPEAVPRPRPVFNGQKRVAHPARNGQTGDEPLYRRASLFPRRGRLSGRGFVPERE